MVICFPEHQVRGIYTDETVLDFITFRKNENYFSNTGFGKCFDCTGKDLELFENSSQRKNQSARAHASGPIPTVPKTNCLYIILSALFYGFTVFSVF